jgi:tripartite-type tricarboxylate transporter receptor subunit TctC
VKLARRPFLHLAAGAAILPAVSRVAWAQTYPTRPVTLIVPFAAGGGTDVVARIVGEHMSRTLGQQVIVENVPGAGGTTGSIRTMRANPDGHTIEMGQSREKLAGLQGRAGLQKGRIREHGTARP